MPQGHVNFGEALTYTLVITAPPGASVWLNDPLQGVTFSRFVAQPLGVEHVDGVVSGTVTFAVTDRVTVSFVTRVGVPGTVGWTVTVTNRACVYPFSGTLGGCVWSNEVTNPAFRPYGVFLPMVLRYD
jgi:hypothetical protein